MHTAIQNCETEHPFWQSIAAKKCDGFPGLTYEVLHGCHRNSLELLCARAPTASSELSGKFEAAFSPTDYKHRKRATRKCHITYEILYGQALVTTKSLSL